MISKGASLCILLLAAVSAYTLPTLSPPDVTMKEINSGRKLLDDKSTAQMAFWTAINNGDAEAMRKAKDDGADPEAKTAPSGYRPIHLAASIGNINVVLLLLQYKVDPNVKTNNGTTPLHYAANHGDTAVVTLLLEAGADPNIADNRGFVPLHFASYGNLYQVKGYADKLQTGYKSITTEASSEISKTATIQSKSTTIGMGDFLGCVSQLLKHGANPKAATIVKETPLHYTPAFDQFEITALLIKAGADVNAVDEEKEVPLHEATAYGAIGVTQLLLNNGADASAKEEHGLTPEDFICRCNTYKNDLSLTQCAPGKCSSGYDTMVIRHVFDVYNGKD